MNGDWFTYLLILIFFVFPLIQQILEAAKRNQAPPRSPRVEGDVGEEGEAVSAQRYSGADAHRGLEVVYEESSGAGWSEGWGDWPEDSMPEPESVHLPDLPEPIEVLAEPEPAVPEPWAVEPEPMFEPVSLPVERYATYDLAGSHEPEAPSVAVSVLAPAHRAAVAVPHKRLDIGAAMRSPGRLRDAIILSEVLGPPKALRDDDVDRHIG